LEYRLTVEIAGGNNGNGLAEVVIPTNLKMANENYILDSFLEKP
jgi:hypothetical protein